MSSSACRNPAPSSAPMSTGHGATVDRDRELLAGQVRRAHVRAGADVAEAHRVGRRAEVERAAVEDRRRPARRSGGRRRSPWRARAGTCRCSRSATCSARESPLGRVDPQQVLAGGGVAAVEQLLQALRGRRRSRASAEQTRWARARAGAGIRNGPTPRTPACAPASGRTARSRRGCACARIRATRSGRSSRTRSDRCRGSRRRR